jgi:hypothetical protein
MALAQLEARMNFSFVNGHRDFTVEEMSEAIVNFPNSYTMLTRMGLFPAKGIRTTEIHIERKDYGELNVIPVSDRGDYNPPRGYSRKPAKKVIPSMYLNYGDNLLASDLQNVRQFGMPDHPDFLEDFTSVLMEKMADLSGKYFTTFEFMQWGALRGDVLDADGSTVLYNCFDEMGESQYDFDLKLGSDTDEVMKALRAQRRWIARNLRGERIRGHLRLLSTELFDALVDHPHYKKIYENQQNILENNPNFQDLGLTGFVHGGEIFIEYTGEATYIDPDDGSTTVVQHIPQGEGIAIPIPADPSTQQIFRSFFTPGTMMDSVNLPGRPIYTSLKELDHNRGVEIFSESAPLFMVMKPRLVHRLYSSNGLAPTP